MKLIKLSFISIIVALFILACVCLITGLIGMFGIPYIANTWLVYLGKEATVTATQGFLWGLIPPVGVFSAPGSFITWLCMLFLV